MRFSTRSQREEFERQADRAKFYRELSYRMTIELARIKAELERMNPDPETRIVNHEIDDTLQTGNSRDLGGAMSIHAPYSEE